jgi:hypothetical protein
MCIEKERIERKKDIDAVLAEKSLKYFCCGLEHTYV